MGTSISGGMLLGLPSNEVSSSVYDENTELYGEGEDGFEDFTEWYEEEGMSSYSEHYDAGEDSCFVGFEIGYVNPLSKDFGLWTLSLMRKARRFKELTGEEPTLVGMQNIS